MSKQHFKATGAGPLHVSLGSNLGLDFNIYEVRLHLSTVSTGADNFTVSILSSGNTASPYNTLIATQLMTSVMDYVFRPAAPVHLKHNDKLACDWVNDASSYKTYGLEAVWDYF